MATWHPTIVAYEIFGTRQQSANITNPSVSVTLWVEANDVDTFVDYIVINRPVYPLSSPFYLYATQVNVLPPQARYAAGGASDDYISLTDPVQVQITYTADGRIATTLYDGPTGTGGAQDVFLTEEVQIVTEFLTMDYNDFQWSDGTPLTSADLAPGKIFRTYKVMQTWELVELTAGLQSAIYDYSGTVNSNSMYFSTFISKTFTAEQVLFGVEAITPTVKRLSQIDVMSGTVQLYTLRLSFTCKSGDATWNKFWRMAQTSGQDVSGWYEIYHRKSDTEASNPAAKVYEATSAWDMFTL